MYDMYRWDQPGTPRDAAVPALRRRCRASGPGAGPGPGTAPAGRPRRPGEAARALQEALDRRDNGGDAAAAPRA